MSKGSTKEDVEVSKSEQLKLLAKVIGRLIENGQSSHFQVIDWKLLQNFGLNPALLKDDEAQVMMSKLGILAVQDVKNYPLNLLKLDQKIVDENRSVLVKQDGTHPFFKPRWYKNLKECLEMGEHAFLVGPTGCGKTSMCRILADDMSRKFFRMNLNGETTVDNFVGSVRLTNKETIFEPGILVQAMQAGGLLLLDEVDSAQPEVLFTLHSVLEGNPVILYEDGARMIKPAKGFVVVAAANTLGRGDDSGLYAGTNILNEAFLDRFVAIFNMEYSEQEFDIVKHYVDEKMATKLVAFAKDMRKAFVDNKILTVVSTRRLIEIARKVTQWGMFVAFDNILMSRVNPDDKEKTKEIAFTHSLISKPGESVEL